MDMGRILMKHYDYPVAFTGAGISVASGLPTFDATWKGIPVRDLLTRDWFDQDPVGFYDFFKSILDWGQKSPNPAHRGIAEAGIPVVTQNIDGLHQKAGSQEVYEVHGNLREMVCPECGRVYPWKPLDAGLPHCHCGKVLKPQVVLFGDDLLVWDEAVTQMERADLVLVVGCSLTVAPACYLPEIAMGKGAETIVINERAETEVPRVLTELGMIGCR